MSYVLTPRIMLEISVITLTCYLLDFCFLPSNPKINQSNFMFKFKQLFRSQNVFICEMVNSNEVGH